MKDDFKSQVENRLDELFHEDGEIMEPLKFHADPGDHPLRDLKALLLSVDWEITDSSMENLTDELESLEGFYSNDKIILTFLRLIRTVARYIKIRKGQSHANAAALLSSLYNSLEGIALSKGMSRKEKEKILLQEVEKFQKMKEEVIRQGKEKEAKAPQGKAASPDEGVAAPVERAAPDFERMTPQEAVRHALQEIKELIRTEFKALREEIQLRRESR